MPPRSFRCPACGARFVAEAWQAHMAQATAERIEVFARFLADHVGLQPSSEECTGGAQVVPLMDPEEAGRFGATGPCGPVSVPCGCGGSFCVAHAFACRRCGRFACLRHRWSGRCPECTGRHRAVHVPKYDVFSKTRSVFVRTYGHDAGAEPWPALDARDGPSDADAEARARRG